MMIKFPSGDIASFEMQEGADQWNLYIEMVSIAQTRNSLGHGHVFLLFLGMA